MLRGLYSQALQKLLFAGTGMRSSGLCGTVGATGAGIYGDMMYKRWVLMDVVLTRNLYLLTKLGA